MTSATVLIVDDDAALLQALPEALHLRMSHAVVDTADSAAAALRRIAETDYDAIVCDIKMPGMDGLALLAEIRALRPDTPTLLITGHGEHDLAVQALRGGAYDFIQKPIDRDYFIASLHRAIQLRQLRREVERQSHALERHACELEQIVQERTKQLQQANATKDRFLAVLSHELRNPLTAIQTATHVLRRYAAGDRNLSQVAEVIGRNVNLQARLVNDLLDLSRFALGKVQLSPRPVRLDELVNAVAGQQRPRAEETGQTLRMRGMPNVWVLGDMERLEQVIGNVIGNAIKFTPRGGRITVTVARLGEKAYVTVEDTGAGIDESEIHCLFELFRQGKQSGVGQLGLGIGLALVKQLVEVHGGRITAESEGRGKGSRFTIELPAISLSLGGDPVMAQDPAQDHVRVLMVDDNADANTFLAKILQMEGCTVATAATGEEALEVLAAGEPPDVILADLGLPGIDGRMFLRMARELPGMQDVPALVLSGYGEEADIRASLEAGFSGHLVKPYGVDELLARIREVVTVRR
jgi:two-component system sensor histidine kinase/response regulator